MKNDATAEALRKEKICKTILQDLASTFPPGRKFQFNKPGYESYAVSKFPHISVDQDKLNSCFRIYQTYELVEIRGNTIEVKEKALEYV